MPYQTHKPLPDPIWFKSTGYVRNTHCALILVTHSLQQARRIADEALYFHKGCLLESGAKETVLYVPEVPETRQFLEFYGV